MLISNVATSMCDVPAHQCCCWRLLTQVMLLILYTISLTFSKNWMKNVLMLKRADNSLAISIRWFYECGSFRNQLARTNLLEPTCQHANMPTCQLPARQHGPWCADCIIGVWTTILCWCIDQWPAWCVHQVGESKLHPTPVWCLMFEAICVSQSWPR